MFGSGRPRSHLHIALSFIPSLYAYSEIIRRLRCVPQIKYEPKLWTHKSQEVKTAKTRKTSTYEWRMRAVDAVDILDDELVSSILQTIQCLTYNYPVL